MDAGLEGQQAGTTLRMALIRLSDPPKEAAGALEELGIKITDAAGEMLPFDQIIQQLADSTDGMGSAAKLAALSQIFGAEAASGMLTVIDAGPEKLRKFTDELVNSEGSAKKTAQAMKDNLKGSIEELGGAFETLLISIGTALTPAIQGLTVLLTSLINMFNGLSEGTKTTIAILAGLTVAFALIAGPIMILVAILPNIIAGFSAIAGAIGITSSALLGIIGVVAGVVAALALIGVGLVIAYNKVEWFRDLVNTAWENIKSAFNTALTFVQGIVQQVMSVVAAFIGEKLAQIQAFWAENGAMIMEAASNVWNVIKTIIDVVMTAIMAIMKTVWPLIRFLIESTWDAIKGVINGAINIILGIIKTFSALFTGNWSALWEGIKQTILGALQFIWNFLSLMMLGKIVGILKSFVALGKTLLTNFWTGIKSLFTSSGSAISNATSATFNFIKRIIDGVMNGIKSLVTNAWSTVKNIFTSSVNFAKTAVSNGFNAMKSTVSSLMNGIKTTIKDAWDKAVNFLKGIDLKSIGENIVKGLIDGIAGMAGSLLTKVKELANLIPEGLKDFLGIHSPSRLIRDEVGKWIPLGLTEGMDGQIGEIKSTTASMASAAVPRRPAGFTPQSNDVIRNGVTYGPNYITIDAKNVREFNDVVRVMKDVKQTNRSR